MVEKHKPGRLTDNKWWFCEIGEHKKCAVKIELSSRFEGCPCECHQTASTATVQPASDTSDDWHTGTGGGLEAWRVYDGEGRLVAKTVEQWQATVIAADHNQRVLLVDTLTLVRRLLIEQGKCEQSLCAGCDDARQSVLETIDAALHAAGAGEGEEEEKEER